MPELNQPDVRPGERTGPTTTAQVVWRSGHHSCKSRRILYDVGGPLSWVQIVPRLLDSSHGCVGQLGHRWWAAFSSLAKSTQNEMACGPRRSVPPLLLCLDDLSCTELAAAVPGWLAQAGDIDHPSRAPWRLTLGGSGGLPSSKESRPCNLKGSGSTLQAGFAPLALKELFHPLGSQTPRRPLA